MNNNFHLGYADLRTLLERRLDEKAPSHIQMLTGPRQVGKTTLLLEIARSREASALYAAGDGPEAALPGFWERFWARVEETAHLQGKAVALLDEIHRFANWSERLKGEWDRILRRRLPVHVVVSGSSALRLAAGRRESLAGRFERLTLPHWPARALADTFGLAPREATGMVVQTGSYPGAVPLRKDPARWTAYVRDAIVEPAVARDVLAMADVRRPGLLRQVFAICTSSPAQVVSLMKIQGQLQDAGALATVSHYLDLLEQAYLVAPLEKYSTRPIRSRGAPPKLVTLNNALLAASDPRGIPDPAREPDRFGAWVENACLSFAWNSGQKVTYWREEPFEVDGIVEGSWDDWALEIKTGSFGTADIRGLLEFTRRHPRFRPLVVTDPGGGELPRRLGIPTTTWMDFLMSGPPPHDSGVVHRRGEPAESA